MKRFHLGMLLCCAVCCGCKSETADPDGAETHRNDAKVASQSGSPASASVVSVSEDTHQLPPAQTYTSEKAARTTAATSPDEVCRRFMNALQQGNQSAVFQHLTQQAALEMQRADLEMEPVGEPQSEVQVMPPRYATSKQRVAQVDCLVASPGNPDAITTVTWLLSRKTTGWKISGMTVYLQDGGMDLLSFENPDDVYQIKESVGGDAAPEHRQAAAPDELIERYR